MLFFKCSQLCLTFRKKCFRKALQYNTSATATDNACNHCSNNEACLLHVPAQHESIWCTCLIKSLFGEAAATSQPKSRAVSSAEALGPPNEFLREMNGEKKCERGGEKNHSRVYKKDSYSSQSIQVFFWRDIVWILHGALFSTAKK